MEEHVLTLILKYEPTSAISKAAIRAADLAAGKKKDPFVRARLLPDSDGHAVLYWDMVSDKNQGKRPRFAFGMGAFHSDLQVVIEKADRQRHTITIKNAAPHGRQTLALLASDCRSFQVLLKNSDPKQRTLEPKPSAAIAFGKNLLAEELDERGKDAKEYDPCWRTLTRE